jgi:hypothetical protein
MPLKTLGPIRPRAVGERVKETLIIPPPKGELSMNLKHSHLKNEHEPQTFLLLKMSMNLKNFAS